eukprot:m.791145 g.791145  ORF g.791145 m.791145 type:complete len:51 (+) comp23330_c1_seq6:3581-3733(+)
MVCVQQIRATDFLRSVHCISEQLWITVAVRIEDQLQHVNLHPVVIVESIF